MSTKKNLFLNINCADKLSEKEILKKNIQPRISEVNHKRNKTFLKDKTWDVIDKEITVNPLYKNIIKKVICIDSKFRTDYCNTLSTDYTIQLNFNLKNVISMRLESIEVPNTWFLISEEQKNNYFYIIIGGVKHKITVPDGNYSESTFVNWIMTNPFKVTPSPGLIQADPPLPNNFTMECGCHDGKITIANNSGASFKLLFDTTECGDCTYQKTLGWIMGFRDIMYSGTYVFKGEGIYDSGGTRYFYLVVNDYNKNVNDFIIGNLKSSYLNKNILAKIPVIKGKFSMLYNEVECKNTQKRDYFGPVNIERLNIQLLDEWGDIINLNHMDFSIYLSFKMLY